MADSNQYAVTGAFSYSGRYITKRLLAKGGRVITLTNHPDRPNPFGGSVTPAALNFEDERGLAKSLEGMSTLFNTYWIRYPYGDMTHERAVENSRRLFDAAKQAGVRKIVHTSIANPSPDSKLTYYRGKWNVEQALINTGVSYGIMRPVVLFGGENPAEDVLINNIAWILRRLPAFGLPGDGLYGIQPIHVEDLADLAIELSESTASRITDACGPEAFTFRELVELVKRAVGSSTTIMPMHPAFALAAARLLSVFVGDIMLTDEEVIGLMDNLLSSKEKPTGKIKLSKWLKENAHLMGKKYSNEVSRHFK